MREPQREWKEVNSIEGFLGKRRGLCNRCRQYISTADSVRDVEDGDNVYLVGSITRCILAI